MLFNFGTRFWDREGWEQDSADFQEFMDDVYSITVPPYIFTWYGDLSLYKYYTEMSGEPRFNAGSDTYETYTNPAPHSSAGSSAFDDYGYGLLHFHFNGQWKTSKIYYDEGCYSISGITNFDYENQAFQFVRAVEFKNLTLNAGDVYRPLPYGTCGGVFAIKVNNTLTFNGGHIDLTGAGLPTSKAANRQLAAQESNAALDSGTQTGDENKQCVDYFPLNVGDGACFIFAKNIRVTNSASRIGNPNSKGVALCRGAADDSNTPSGVTNIGGSNIFIACETFQGFTPDLISKYRTGSANDGLGKGLARAFIHVENPAQSDVPKDGRLYYLDTQATAPKLHLRKNGAVEDIQLSETKSGNAVGIKTADGIFYANLVDPSAANASSIRIRLNNTTYALANS